MNIDRIFEAMNRHGVQYLLIGGMNFMLRHEPILTFDVDFWIEDSTENRRRCEAALVELEATWGPSDDTWQAVSNLGPRWLDTKHVYCTLTPSGAVDIFRSVLGLPDWKSCHQRAVNEKTKGGVPYTALSDEDLLACQMALDEGERKQSRIDSLRAAMNRS